MRDGWRKKIEKMEVRASSLASFGGLGLCAISKRLLDIARVIREVSKGEC